MNINLDAIIALQGAKAPLYYRYPRQAYPQPAYVLLHEDGRVTAKYMGCGEHFDDDVVHAWDIDPRVTGDALVRICTNMKDKFAAVLEQRNEFDGEFIEVDPDADCAFIVTPDEWCMYDQLQDVWPDGMTLEQAVKYNYDQVEEQGAGIGNAAIVLDEADQTIEDVLLTLAGYEYTEGETNRPEIIKALKEAGVID